MTLDYDGALGVVLRKLVGGAGNCAKSQTDGIVHGCL